MPDGRTQDNQSRRERPRKRPFWPWIVLLVVTLLTIHAYDRTSQAYDRLIRQLPGEIGALLDALLGRALQPETDPAPPTEI